MTRAAMATDDEIATMRARREAGWSYNAIAAELGRSKWSVRYWLDDEYRKRKTNGRPKGRRSMFTAEQRAEREREYRRRRARDPKVRAAKRAAQRRLNKRKSEALAKVKREQVVKDAFKRVGVAEQEAYLMAERFQDVLAQAHRETDDSEKRRHYSLAGEHYRKMRDEIVRALGVS